MEMEVGAKHKTVAGYIFGGLSFIPLIGVVFGIVAIIIGIVKKAKGPILLGAGGIIFTVVIYGGLFYFGFVDKGGPYASLRVQLTQQLMSTDAGQISLYKQEHGKLPVDLSELASSSSPTNAFWIADGWGNNFQYQPKSNGSFELISAGPDGQFGTPDDIIENF